MPPSSRRTMVSFRPALEPSAPPAREATVDPFESAPRWRFQGRDLLALAAIAAAVWFAIRGASLPFHSSGALTPVEASDQLAASIRLDRHELDTVRNLAAAAPSTDRASGGSTGATRGSSSPSGSSNGGSGTKGHPKPPTGGRSDAPLVQATVPGVGSVTVEDPDLLGVVEVPSVPDTGQLTQGTGTLPLPLP
jgi:hypothetical protein